MSPKVFKLRAVLVYQQKILQTTETTINKELNCIFSVLVYPLFCILLIKASCVCFCVCADHTCFYEKSKKDRNLVHSGKGFYNNLSCY